MSDSPDNEKVEGFLRLFDEAFPKTPITLDDIARILGNLSLNLAVLYKTAKEIRNLLFAVVGLLLVLILQ